MSYGETNVIFYQNIYFIKIKMKFTLEKGSESGLLYQNSVMFTLSKYFHFLFSKDVLLLKQMIDS